MSQQIAIVVPTFNERENIRPLLGLLEQALEDISWEMLVVDDDSPDGTAALVREIAQDNPRVRCIQRIGAARAFVGLHQGISRHLRPLRGGDGRRPPARRAAAARHVCRVTGRRAGFGGGQPLHDAQSGLANGWRRWASLAATPLRIREFPYRMLSRSH